MNAHDGNNAFLRTGMRRIFPPWEFRHLEAFGRARIIGGSALAVLGVVTLLGGHFTGEAFAWGGAMLLLAALGLAAGIWQLSIARSAPPRI
jgi:hypothetical protein